MKLTGLRISPSMALACLPLLAVSSLLTGCTNMVTTAPAVPIKTQIGGVKGLIHGGRGPVVGANVYLYSPSLTGYGGSGIAASTLNASTSLMNNSVPSTCGAGATATAIVDTNPADSTYQQITGITVNTGGAGYFISGAAAPPTVTITDSGGGTGATATAVLGTNYNGSQPATGGFVTSITLNTPGSGYVSPVVTITPSSTSPCNDGTNYYVTSDANGNFSLSGDYTCTAGLPVYIYTIGGDAGSGAAGDDGFMAVLGICPASGTLAGVVSYVTVDELSTIAAAYAVAGFATDPKHIGVLQQTSASTTLQTLELTDLQNAFNTAGNLYPTTTGYAGPAPATTPNGNGTLPSSKLNTLANILANCVNSTYLNYACETLLSYTPNQTDTAGAAIYIAQHPYTNASKIFALATANGAPWQPALTAAPFDWTISIIYTGGGLTTSVSGGSYDFAAHVITADASGNIWVAGAAGGNVLSEFSNLGVPLSGVSGFTNSGINGPVSATVDAASANVWLANGSAATLSVYNIAGGTWSTITPVTSGTTAALSSPLDVGFDGSGNVFVPSPGNDYLVKLNSSGTYITRGSNTNYVAYPLAVAIEPGAAGSVWAIGEASRTNYKYAALWTNSMTLSAEPKTDEYYSLSGAIDSSGNVWVANYQYYVTKATSAGTLVANYQIASNNYYVPDPSAVAVDGANNIWFNDVFNSTIDELNNSGVNQVGNYGYVPAGEPTNYKPGTATPTGYIQPYGLVIDGSGNVWFEELGTAAMQEMVGVAAPVVTPLAFATANSLYGVRP